MKNLLYLLITFLVVTSCNKESSFVIFSGKITNNTSDSLVVFQPETNFSKVIKIQEDGTFKDTLKVENGMFSMTDNHEFALLYLVNGDHVTMHYDTKDFDKTIKFSGQYSKENKFLKESLKKEEELFSDTNLLEMPKNSFDAKVSSYVQAFNERLVSGNLDSTFVNYQKEEIINVKEYVEKEYEEKNFEALYLRKGKESPKFTNYENFKGGTTSLDDLKGKYVYIDVWATWCQPCKAEIPFLKKIEEEFHDKNIEFVSVSIDEKSAYGTWKQMVTDMELGGIQLYSKGDKNFTTAFRIKSIPRFILLDPEGKIVSADAPRPSSTELIETLNSLTL